MKGFTILFLLSITGPCFSQEKVEVSYDKAVILVFDQPVKPKGGWNCGDKEMVGVAVSENKILLQAREPDFDETNLFVELVDGSFFAFDLVYNNSPKKTVWTITNTKAVLKQGAVESVPNAKPEQKESVTQKQNKDGTKISNSIVTDTKNKPPLEPVVFDVEQNCKDLIVQGDYINRLGVIGKKMLLKVGGMWILDSKLYFKVTLKNESTIPYDINYGEFVVKNTARGIKNQSAQAERKKMLGFYSAETGFVLNDDNDGIYGHSFGVVGGKESLTVIYVFEKFTIAENKMLYLDFWEDNGDRSLELPIESVELLNAKSKI